MGERLQCLSRIFLFVDVEAFDDGLPRGAGADVILYSFNKPQVERRRLFVGRDAMGQQKLADARHLRYVARKGAPIVANFILYLRCGHISQILFNQLFRFVQPFNLIHHLLQISFMVNSIDLIIILAMAEHLFLNV